VGSPMPSASAARPGMRLCTVLLAATLAVLPPVLNGAQSLSMLPVLTSLGWILLSGSLWVGLAINVAFRGHFRDALREL
ncbi:MAG: hypothetical protein LR011_03360, partial [Verrucomicrobia bacterium]|nr:hypothetical protein [Verrucomicrobiota bacterium]